MLLCMYNIALPLHHVSLDFLKVRQFNWIAHCHWHQACGMIHLYCTTTLTDQLFPKIVSPILDLYLN